jgi:hypothetical protein
LEELGKTTPYGVYNVNKNIGFVNVGASHDASGFVVESIRRIFFELRILRRKNFVRSQAV